MRGGAVVGGGCESNCLLLLQIDVFRVVVIYSAAQAEARGLGWGGGIGFCWPFSPIIPPEQLGIRFYRR